LLESKQGQISQQDATLSVLKALGSIKLEYQSV
ncbi:MAG: cytidine deaminase, partial [Aeromonas sp.]